MPRGPAAAGLRSNRPRARNRSRTPACVPGMEPDLFRFDDHHSFARKKTNFFAWTIAILLLSGVALAAWLGSFYVIGQPERPESYRLLQRLHKIEPPKRFALTAAPAGEFLNPKQLCQRYQSMGPAELARK